MKHLFELDGDKYVPTDWARGPWDPALLHGGPPAALLAHALEEERNDSALWTTRITIDLLRPVRLAPLRTSRQVVREGKRIKLVDAFLHDGDTLVARASGLMLRRNADPAQSPASAAQLLVPSWEALPPRDVGHVGNLGDLDGGDTRLFHRGTEFRTVPKTQPDRNFAVWIRIPYLLLPDQPLAGLEYVAAISDYVNAAGTMAHPARRGFINADITLNLHREASGEWICMESISRPDHAGIATSAVSIHDAAGLLGSASSCCLANARPKHFGAAIGIAGE